MGGSDVSARSSNARVTIADRVFRWNRFHKAVIRKWIGPEGLLSDFPIGYICFMKTIRKIRQVWKSEPTIEGAGVHLRRAFGYRQLPELDPFLLLDDFHSSIPADYLNGFPWHPHRGIETITYVLDGDVEHGDSLGNQGSISSGDVQWMTAGSGIIHQEMPKGDNSGRLWGFQLWANLPASHKMMMPRYQDVKNSEIPEAVLEGGVRVRIISGSVGGVRGPVQNVVIDPEFLDISVPAHTVFVHPVKRGHTAFAYVIEGWGYFDQEQNPFQMKSAESASESPGTPNGAETLIIYEDGDEIVVATKGNPVRFILVSGKPLREPVAWHGPIVMNTREELKIAFEEYEKGTFIKHV
jgi:quercetin 2,3-dioxygenase